jgi:hypothetical protein
VTDNSPPVCWGVSLQRVMMRNLMPLLRLSCRTTICREARSPSEASPTSKSCSTCGCDGFKVPSRPHQLLNPLLWQQV